MGVTKLMQNKFILQKLSWKFRNRTLDEWKEDNQKLCFKFFNLDFM